MAEVPPWDPDETVSYPVGPEPEPTGVGGPRGPGGWGSEPPREPYAIAALVWAFVPLAGALVALILSNKAADSIRRSRGTRRGQDLVTAARIGAGVNLAVCAIALIAFLAVQDTDERNDASPRPPGSSTTTTTTTTPSTTATTSTTTTTRPASTTAATTTSSPTTSVSVVVPPSSAAPSSSVASSTTTTTTVAPSTTTAAQRVEHDVEERLLGASRLGPSNRGVADGVRFDATYTAGSQLVITWAIDRGTGPAPTGAACTAPATTTTTTSTTTPGSSSSSSSTTSSSTTTSSTSSTTTTTTTAPTSSTSSTTTTSVPPARQATRDLARFEARQILTTLRNRIDRLNLTTVRLVGSYPLTGGTESKVVEVVYSKATASNPTFEQSKAFDVPPAQSLVCLAPAFA